jgi:Flp pilus assembly protein TadG
VLPGLPRQLPAAAVRPEDNKVVGMGVWTRQFFRNERGSVAPLFAVALVALIASGGLAWDISRGFALRAELEAAVDAAALAGATQLDGETNARTRAISAAQGAFVQNAQNLADTREANVAIAGTDIAFLQDLTTRAVATGDADAEFIEITLAPRSLGLVMGAISGATGFNASAHAVAGYGSALCLVPPLLVCNPNEATSLTFDGDNYTGKAFVLTPSPKSKNDEWNPGNFGFLDVGSGANAIKDAMGRFPPMTQCFGETVQTQPGNIESADDWFNTRFDIYQASAGGFETDPAFAPAMNTMIGAQTNSGSAACNPTTVTPSDDCSSAAADTQYVFPRDCGMGTASVGSGEWNGKKYFATNHSGIDPTTYTPAAPAAPEFGGSGWGAYGPEPVNSGPAVTTGGIVRPTRFQVYNWEKAILSGAISNPAGAFSGGQALNPASGNADHARPTCNTTGAQTTPDRRMISSVIANCNLDDVKGASTVNIIAEVDFFLTAPAKDASIYGEFIRATPAANSPVLNATRRDWVRLYE